MLAMQFSKSQVEMLSTDGAPETGGACYLPRWSGSVRSKQLPEGSCRVAALRPPLDSFTTEQRVHLPSSCAGDARHRRMVSHRWLPRHPRSIVEKMNSQQIN